MTKTTIRLTPNDWYALYRALEIAAEQYDAYRDVCQNHQHAGMAEHFQGQATAARRLANLLEETGLTTDDSVITMERA